jgi:hypothetical protein
MYPEGKHPAIVMSETSLVDRSSCRVLHLPYGAATEALQAVFETTDLEPEIHRASSRLR